MSSTSRTKLHWSVQKGCRGQSHAKKIRKRCSLKPSKQLQWHLQQIENRCELTASAKRKQDASNPSPSKDSWQHLPLSQASPASPSHSELAPAQPNSSQDLRPKAVLLALLPLLPPSSAPLDSDQWAAYMSGNSFEQLLPKRRRKFRHCGRQPCDVLIPPTTVFQGSSLAKPSPLTPPWRLITEPGRVWHLLPDA